MKLYSTILFAGLLSGLLVSSISCADNDTVFPDKDKEVQGKEIIVYATQQSGVGTRVIHEYDDESEEMVVNWVKDDTDRDDDAFYLFRESGDPEKALFEVEEINGGVATFTGSWSGETTGSFNAFYPARWIKDNNWDWSTCCFDVTGQVQKGNDNTVHLSDYNYMTLKESISFVEEGMTFSFQHHTAILRLKITLPMEVRDKKPIGLVLGSYGDSTGFVIKERVASAFPTKSEELALTLKDIELDETGSFIAYLAVLESDLKGKLSCRVELENEEQTYSFEGDLPEIGITYEKGMIYSSDIELTVDDPTIFGNGIKASLNFGGGSGTEESPYQIFTARQLKRLVEKVNEGDVAYKDKYYRLMADILVTADEWIPIGSSAYPFAGYFDGNENTVKGELNIPKGASGFFGIVQGTESNPAVIEKLTINATVRGNSFIGSVAGKMNNHCVIKKCTSKGSVSANNSTYVYMGGLVGTMQYSKITECLNEADVSCNLTALNMSSYIGGLVGLMYKKTELDQSENKGDIKGVLNGSTTKSLAMYSGGLLGGTVQGSPNISITNCKNQGKVAVQSEPGGYAYAGGLVGFLAEVNFVADAPKLSENTSANPELTATKAVGYWIGNCRLSAEIDLDTNKKEGDFGTMEAIGEKSQI